ncbi:MAG: VOC family protein [Flavobacteriaceae bacterium]
MMTLHPYLIMNGQAREALAFYTQALGIEHSEIKTYENSPIPHSQEQKEWVMHAELLFKKQTIIMIADSSDIPLNDNPNIHLSLNYTDLESMKSAFAKLSEGGKIIQDLALQHWNATFGRLTDKYGLHWMMNCDHSN